MTQKQKSALIAMAIVLILILGAVIWWANTSKDVDKSVAEYQTTLDAMSFQVTQTAAAIGR